MIARPVFWWQVRSMVAVALGFSLLAAAPGCDSGPSEIPKSQSVEQSQAEINYPFGGAPAGVETTGTGASADGELVMPPK